MDGLGACVLCVVAASATSANPLEVIILLPERERKREQASLYIHEQEKSLVELLICLWDQCLAQCIKDRHQL